MIPVHCCCFRDESTVFEKHGKFVAVVFKDAIEAQSFRLANT